MTYPEKHTLFPLPLRPIYRGMALKVFPIFAKNIFIVRLYTRKGGLLYSSIQFSIQFTFLVVFRMYRIISLD